MPFYTLKLFIFVRKTTKLIEGGHRGLQDIRYSSTFLRFYVFFSKSKSPDFLHFLQCFVRFLSMAPFDPPTMKRHKVYPITRCADTAIRNFPRWRPATILDLM